MEYLVIIIGCLFLVAVIYFNLNVKVFKLKQEVEDEELNEIVNKLPENEEVCKSVLKKLNNENVNIKINEDTNDKTSLYMVLTNTIFIANIKDTYTRLQTIAHECIHSIQNKKMLLFNFIYTNIFNLYYIVLLLLTVLKIVKDYKLQIIILLIMGLVYYFVRAYLETDAMIRARYIAEDYMNDYYNNIEGKNIISQDEIKKVCDKYDEINKKGIPLYNFILFLKIINKLIFYCMIVFIITIINNI